MLDILSALTHTAGDFSLPLFWSVLGVLLIIIEIIAPGFFLLWVGIAALCTALIAYLTPLTVAMSWIMFAGLSLIILFFTRRLYKHFFKFNSTTQLNQRGADLIGKTMILEEPIQNGRGYLRIGDSIWAIQGDDMVSGTNVIITGIVGNHLVVKKLS
ncbi:MAG: NfeD family protein [Alphaproteobacteria bacterium]|nr:NfeD family protein [Alphaproteobacteria bacterium]